MTRDCAPGIMGVIFECYEMISISVIQILPVPPLRATVRPARVRQNCELMRRIVIGMN